MARVLITGMSGVGKSTLIDELRRRGHLGIDTDYDGWTLADGTWDEPRMHRLLDLHLGVVVSGTVENQRLFYAWFDHVVLLSAPLDVLLARLQTRTNNPYGKSLDQAADVSRYVADVQPLLSASCSLELDGERPVQELADTLEPLIVAHPKSPETR